MIRKQNKKRRFFTLLEIMVAMAILLILMAFLFQFMTAATKAWRMSESNSRIQEQAGVILELLAKDLQNAVVSQSFGREIPFNYGDINTTRLGMVSATDIKNSELAEITYWLDTTDPLNHQLKRCYIRSHNLVATPNPKWNFFGNLDGTCFNDDVTQTTETIANGVEECTITFEPQLNGNMNILPKIAIIKVTLKDAKLPIERQPKTRRTFSKVIFLPGTK